MRVNPRMRDRWCYRDDGLFLWKLCRQRSETLSAQPLDEFTFCMVVVGVSINYSNYTVRVCVCERDSVCVCVCVCVSVCVCAGQNMFWEIQLFQA